MLEEIQKFLKSKSYKELREISEETGISLETLKSIRYGRRTNPTYKTVEALKEVIKPL